MTESYITSILNWGALPRKQNLQYVVYEGGTPQSWKVERKKLRIANQTLTMILDLLSFMSKDRVSLATGLK